MLKGWDFEELADEWGLYLPDYLDAYSTPSSVDWIKLYLREFMYGLKRKRVRRKAAKDIRTHCKLISEYEEFGESTIWKAMSEIEDEYTLINFFIPLVGFAWT